MKGNVQNISTRKDIINLQKAILARTKKNIKNLMGYQSEAIKKYYYTYKSQFTAIKHFKVISLQALLNEILDSNIIYCGDYHTLKQSQRTILRLLREIYPKNNNIIVGMEMFQISDQEYVDLYMEDKIDEANFLIKIDYWNTWGFNFPNFKPILEFCKANKLKVLALNSRSTGKQNRLKQRDKNAAEAISKSINENPNFLHFIQFGDLHLSPEHLPNEVKINCIKKIKDTLILQNSETLYWKLVEKGIENEAEFIELKKKRHYCIMNSTPWVKLQSYQNWIEVGEELLCKNQLLVPYDEEEEDLFEYRLHVEELISKITYFIGLDDRNIEDFRVYTPEDIFFLIELKKKIPRFDSHLKRIRENKCYFIPKENIIYIADLDINHAAEVSTEFIYYINSKYDIHYSRIEDEFYRRIFRKALAFFGSKLINPRRRVKDEQYLFAISVEQKPQGYRGFVEIDRKVAPYVISHNQILRQNLKGKKYKETLKKIYRDDTRYNLEISKKIGFILGEKIYTAFYAGRLNKDSLQNLFKNPLNQKGEALNLYKNFMNIK
ncbi:MAG: ChaN family lipoprotein [Pseudomonadota bacterium]